MQVKPDAWVTAINYVAESLYYVCCVDILVWFAWSLVMIIAGLGAPSQYNCLSNYTCNFTSKPLISYLYMFCLRTCIKVIMRTCIKVIVHTCIELMYHVTVRSISVLLVHVPSGLMPPAYMKREIITGSRYTGVWMSANSMADDSTYAYNIYLHTQMNCVQSVRESKKTSECANGVIALTLPSSLTTVAIKTMTTNTKARQHTSPSIRTEWKTYCWEIFETLVNNFCHS